MDKRIKYDGVIHVWRVDVLNKSFAKSSEAKEALAKYDEEHGKTRIPTTLLHITVSIDLRKKVQEAADKQGITLSEFVRKAIMKEVNDYGEQK